MTTQQNAITLPVAGAVPQTTRSAQIVFQLLKKIGQGTLSLGLPDGQRLRFGQGEPSVSIEIEKWRFFDRVVQQGDLGFADAWIDGDWHTSALPQLLTLLTKNREALSKAMYGQWFGLMAARLRHFFNANTRDGARRNILAHYDLGNSFYSQWLDSTMTYSSALYSGNLGLSLKDAQIAKYRRILTQLKARPGERLLEIGCGWGGFAETAAREAGLNVFGITLSPAQLQYAQKRIDTAGLKGQVRLELGDYRDLGQERFEHIVSIEMFEAVGERWWSRFFATLKQRLAAGGCAVVQSIVIRDDLFSRYRRGTDFIQSRVFPGGMLASKSVFCRQAEKAGLMVKDAFSFGHDYSRTLSTWAQAFKQAWPTIADLGFDERFFRLWTFYLAYCQAGFDTGSTDVIQFTLNHRP